MTEFRLFSAKFSIKTAIFLIVILIFFTSIKSFAQPPQDEINIDSIVNRALDNAEKDLQGYSHNQIVKTDEEEEPHYVSDLIINDLQINDTDIKDVLNLFSVKSGFNINFDDVDVHMFGKVSIFLNKISVLDALRAILGEYNLAYIKTGSDIRIVRKEKFFDIYGRGFDEKIKTKIKRLKNVKPSEIFEIVKKEKSPEGKIFVDDVFGNFILIDSPDKIQSLLEIITDYDIPLVTEIFEFKKVKVKEAEESIKEVLTPSKGSLNCDEESNTMTITDTMLKIKEVGRLIEAIDHKNDNIEISAKVLQIVLSDEHINGVDWSAIVSKFQSLPFVNLENSTENSKSRLSIGILTAEDYNILLEALDTVGQIETILYEKKSVINNNVSQIAFKPVISDEYENKGNNDVIIKVIPHITRGDEFNVNIMPRILESDIVERSADINLKNGSTIVIGSLFNEEVINYAKGLPVLKNIPILGQAFRSSGRRVQRIEYVVFLTLRVKGD